MIYHIYQDKNLAKKARMLQKNHLNIPNAVIKTISKVKVMQVKKDLLTRQIESSASQWLTKSAALLYHVYVRARSANAHPGAGQVKDPTRWTSPFVTIQHRMS